MSRSVHDRLRRVRRPITALKYELHDGVQRELPFVVGVLADLSSDRCDRDQSFHDRLFVDIDRDNLDDILDQFTPRLRLRVADRLANDGCELPVELEFHCMNDFEPAQVARQVAPLRSLLETRTKMAALLEQVEYSADPIAELQQLLDGAGDPPAANTLDSIVREQDRKNRGESRPATSNSLRPDDPITALIQAVIRDVPSVDRDVVRSISNQLEALDRVISRQLAEVMQHPAFQQLEGTWRGLHYLVMNSETNAMLKLRVLDCSKSELLEELDRAAEFDQSDLFQKIYVNEFSRLEGEPFAALIGDFYFDHSPEDISLLTSVSRLAATCFCPFIAGASPALMRLGDWSQLSSTRDINELVSGPDHAAWHSFRKSDDSRFVVLTMPRCLARLPYGTDTRPIEDFAFEEFDDDAHSEATPNPQAYCWMNTAYLLGVRLTAAFSTYGWCTRIYGMQGGGKVEGLPLHIRKTPDGEAVLYGPTEVELSHRVESELSQMGLQPLAQQRNTDVAVFLGAVTCHQPPRYDAPEPTANATIAAHLPYIMATSRFVHYVKVAAHAMLGAFSEPQDLEKWLNHWIMHYVAADDSCTAEIQARYPLREARIEIQTSEEQPGTYLAVIYMRPWLPFAELTASPRIVVPLI